MIICGLICLCVLVGYFMVLEKRRIRKLIKYQHKGIEISNSISNFGSLFKPNSRRPEIPGFNIEKESRPYRKLSTSLNQKIDQLSDSIWIKNPIKNTVQDLISRMENHLENISIDGRLKISFEQKITSTNDPISLALKANVYLLFKEAVANIFKYSNGDVLEISLSQTKNTLELKVLDNSLVDLDLEKDLGAGISAMKIRANKIQSDLEINFSKGFLVTLIVGL